MRPSPIQKICDRPGDNVLKLTPLSSGAGAGPDGGTPRRKHTNQARNKHVQRPGNTRAIITRHAERLNGLPSAEGATPPGINPTPPVAENVSTSPPDNPLLTKAALSAGTASPPQHTVPDGWFAK